MAGYTPLFNSIITSTIWRQDDKTRILWITLLALKDRNGIVEGSVPGLADMARISVDECKNALSVLSSPDEESRSQEFEGRRIEKIDGGFRILNHKKYCQKARDRAEYFREYRQKRGKTSTPLRTSAHLCAPQITPTTTTITNKEYIHTHTHAREETNLIEEAFNDDYQENAQDSPESKSDPLTHSQDALSIESRLAQEPDGLYTLENCIDAGILSGLNHTQSEEFFHHYASQGWKLGNGMPIMNLQSAMTRWKNKGFKFEQGGKQKQKQEKPTYTAEEYRENYKKMTGKYPNEK